MTAGSSAPTSTAPAAAYAPPGRHRTAVLVVACAVALMTVLDVSVVTVALPAVQEDLGLGPTGLQWVVNAYSLTLAGFLLLGGRAADLFGTERVFLLGLVTFTLASLAGGLAQSGWQLVAARAVQGLGGAVLAPVTLTLLTRTFPEPAERARALGSWAAVAGIGGALGGVVGGVLTGLLSWRWVLVVNVPVGVLLVGLSLWALGVGTRSRRTSPLDVPGSLLVTLGSAGLVGGITSGESAGWTSPGTLVLLVGAVAALLGFVAVERRASAPLVPLGVFRLRSLVVADLVSLLSGGAVPAMFFFLSLHLQQVRGLDALSTGLALLPGAVGISTGARLAPLLVRRLPHRRVFLVGVLLTVVGLGWLAVALPTDGDLTLTVMVPSALAMLGCGFSGLPVTLAAVADVPPDLGGLASGLLNVSRHLGGALLLAALVAVSSALGVTDPGRGHAAALLVCAGAVLAAGLVGTRLPRPAGRADRGDPAGVSRTTPA